MELKGRQCFGGICNRALKEGEGNQKKGYTMITGEKNGSGESSPSFFNAALHIPFLLMLLPPPSILLTSVFPQNLKSLSQRKKEAFHPISFVELWHYTALEKTPAALGKTLIR
ncbi:hypothetical protein TTE2510 [Caldanaerobacter subterraneus subsp. tengcongensis MB4]|jgi:hypothetical protein|uniref:Uncharacterized protein n=1 Tax=Caldanaerobacter subterraneus subsp. tengcongensis (strain DSM 15242 / JCM 11007 / NBRC 100824 / MB4) TaxID=273068 RepID=Q8R7A8_CALS4|nr:hypothetical protein TTE2510 [Caldanaerobacter subterraneus subsp. tengcongensis MB4]